MFLQLIKYYNIAASVTHQYANSNARYHTTQHAKNHII